VKNVSSKSYKIFGLEQKRSLGFPKFTCCSINAKKVDIIYFLPKFFPFNLSFAARRTKLHEFLPFSKKINNFPSKSYQIFGLDQKRIMNPGNI